MSDKLGKCPICKEGEIVEKNKAYICTKADWKNEGTNDTPQWKNEGCKYGIFKGALVKMGGLEITPENVKTLLETGSFEAELKTTKPILVDEQYGVKINFTK